MPINYTDQTWLQWAGPLGCQHIQIVLIWLWDTSMQSTLSYLLGARWTTDCLSVWWHRRNVICVGTTADVLERAEPDWSKAPAATLVHGNYIRSSRMHFHLEKFSAISALGELCLRPQSNTTNKKRSWQSCGKLGHKHMKCSDAPGLFLSFLLLHYSMIYIDLIQTQKNF